MLTPQQRSGLDRLLRGDTQLGDRLLEDAIALERDGDARSALDLLLARWLLAPDDPSGPWNCVSAFKHLGDEVTAALMRALSDRLIRALPDPSADDVEWAANGLAFAIEEFAAQGAVVTAAALLGSVEDPGEREELAATVRAAAGAS